MRELVYVALLVGLMITGTASAATDAGVSGDPTSTQRARERLTDLLFSDDIDRIDFQATTYEEGEALIATTVEMIFDIAMPVLGDADVVANKAAEVIQALNASKAKGMYTTFQRDKQSLPVRNDPDARELGKIVGTTISIIHGHYGSAKISYGDKAANLFKKVRIDPEDAISLLERYAETVQFVAELPPPEQAKHLN
jgi:hypothetical protein